METKAFRKAFSWGSERVAAVLLWAMVLVFIFFTFWPPQLPLFRDPITGSYGFLG